MRMSPCAALLALAAAAAALSGCGFQPLYGDRGATSSADVQSLLSEVKIIRIADRRGQLIHNGLLDRMNPRGEPANPRYLLFVRSTESTRHVETRADGTATRFDLVITARYELRDGISDVTVFTERSEAAAGYNVLTQRFSTVSAEDEARRRAAEIMADDIALQVSLFLNRRHRLPAAAAPN